jgi:hypothetical protein
VVIDAEGIGARGEPRDGDSGFIAGAPEVCIGGSTAGGGHGSCSIGAAVAAFIDGGDGGV